MNAIGGLEEFLPGRLNLDKTLVVVAAQEDGPGIGRIRMRQILDASAENLILSWRIRWPKAALSTPMVGRIPALNEQGYEHEVTILKRKKKTASELYRAFTCDLASQTLAVRNPSGSGQPETSGLLPGSIYGSG